MIYLLPVVSRPDAAYRHQRQFEDFPPPAPAHYADKFSYLCFFSAFLLKVPKGSFRLVRVEKGILEIVIGSKIVGMLFFVRQDTGQRGQIDQIALGSPKTDFQLIGDDLRIDVFALVDETKELQGDVEFVHAHTRIKYL